MSDVQTAEPKKRNPLLTLVLLACGIIGIVTGIAKMKGGLQEIFGSGIAAEVQKLLTDSDAALAHANEHIQSAGPAFHGLLNDVDTLGLDAVRKDKKAAADDAKSQFAEAAEHLREAQAKLDDAAKHDIDATMKSFIAAKAKSYSLLAEVCDKNVEIVDLVLDESVKTAEELTPKVLDLAAKRDDVQKSADAATAEADAIVKAKS